MTVRVAINGFGRIGRLILRGIIDSKRTDIQVVAINDLGSVEANAHLLKYDSVHGRFPTSVEAADGAIVVDGTAIKVTQEPDPTKLPWKELNIDVALECTGRFADRDSAAQHLSAGARKVLVSAPASGADLTVVYGVNSDQLTAEHTVVSNASCTTNCLAPVAHVLNQAVGLEKGFMTTIHSFTGDQRTVDTLHSDMRRARAASMSMIPTSTGAARAVGIVLPELAGKLDGTSIRVPTANVSVIDLTFISGRDTSVEEINGAITKAAQEGPLKGILGTNDEPLVSIDFNQCIYSSMFDLTQTTVMEGNLVRILSWYDNEWAFSNRMADTAVALSEIG